MKAKFSKWIVATVVFLNVLFTAAVFYVFVRVGSEPTALITAWFAFTTGELWALALIRNTEVKHGAKVKKQEIMDGDNSGSSGGS